MKRHLLAAALLMGGVPAGRAGEKTARHDALFAALAQERRGNPSEAFRLYVNGAASFPEDRRFRRGYRRAASRLEALERRRSAEKRRAAVRRARAGRRLEAVKEKELAARCREARRLVGRRRLFRAYDAYQRVNEEAGDFPPATAGLARVVRRLRAERQKGGFPSEAHALATEGLLSYSESRWSEAATSLERSLAAGELPEDIAGARLAHYAAAARAGEEREAKRAERDRLFSAASTGYREGRIEEAVKALETILSADPGDREAARLLDALGNVSEGARAVFQRDADQKEIAAHMSAGTVFYIDGRHTDALEEFALVLELDPDHPEALGLMKDVRAAMEERGLFAPTVRVENEAERLYREGLRLYGNEKYQEARAAFEAALRTDPGHRSAKEALERIK